MSCIHSCTTQMNVWIYNVFFLQSWPYVGKFAAAICALMRLNVCSGLVVVCVCDVRTVYCVSAANSNKNARLLSLHFTHFTLHFGSHALYFIMANLLCVCARDSLIFVSTMLCQPNSISSHRQFKSEPFFSFDSIYQNKSTWNERVWTTFVLNVSQVKFEKNMRKRMNALFCWLHWKIWDFHTL